MDIQAVNGMSYEEFLDVFGNIIEKCPLITAAVWSSRPFSSVNEMEKCVYEFINSLPSSGKIMLFILLYLGIIITRARVILLISVVHITLISLF